MRSSCAEKGCGPVKENGHVLVIILVICKQLGQVSKAYMGFRRVSLHFPLLQDRWSQHQPMRSSVVGANTGSVLGVSLEAAFL